MKLLSAAQTRALDQATIQNQQISSADLMERAATAVTNWLLDELQPAYGIAIYVFCGPGNNGGDGLAVARQLYRAGYAVQVWLLKTGKHSADFTHNRQQLPAEIPCQELDPDKLPAVTADAVVVDALFGTGLSRPLEGEAAVVVKYLNESGATVVAVDLPSGLFADAPQPADSAVINAHYTLSFELPKLAFLLPQNAKFVGDWRRLPIELDQEVMHNVAVDNHFVTADELRGCLPKRPKFGHKGTFGHALLLAGSRGKIGAAVLASRACLRGGVGLLTTRVPAVGYNIIQISDPEAMCLADPNPDFLTELPDLQPYDAIGIGPGLGQHDSSREVLRQLLETTRVPLVIDADALNLLGANPDLLALLPPGSLLTPHPKEFERLVGEPARDDYHRLDQLRRFAARTRCYCVLKGAYTALATPDGPLYFNSTGNPGMATGGSGDVLTGLLLALRADKRLSPLDAALLGLHAHGRAGDLTLPHTGHAGLLASDIIRFIGPALEELVG
ncbi:bifunctional ADP-dependent NAD(P)H-hydrate dehydratase/NAD(P)H-hydrate epimerase [Hymenobacter amundsenii]|uniref:Bifunctional NAD(P)H-hydrate repair enzyme n=1 Tax=Hymenobacter amundsenii TaxID=2006685 RepID=A0A246FJT9_9BACT|nr:NAD(P)H-hydrate dehydratase [Hymenobacter amundsenii]OWP62844.1 bifunctional ADP-dependent NAD(P)H-hydrate dehydratase/NAD(P)H-hydrate epimerase [Hymenobacter amundsenii]